MPPISNCTLSGETKYVRLSLLKGSRGAAGIVRETQATGGGMAALPRVLYYNSCILAMRTVQSLLDDKAGMQYTTVGYQVLLDASIIAPIAQR